MTDIKNDFSYEAAQMANEEIGNVETKGGTKLLSTPEGAKILTRYEEAVIDPLTKLLNRQGWEPAMKKEFERAVRHHTTFSIAMLDIDDFKSVNDTHGHLAGDEIMRRLGSAVLEEFRTEDIKGRFGGDEMIIMMVDTHYPASSNLINEQNRIASELMSKTHQGISVGLAQWDGLKGLEDVIAEADKRLYQEKESKKQHV